MSLSSARPPTFCPCASRLAFVKADEMHNTWTHIVVSKESVEQTLARAPSFLPLAPLRPHRSPVTGRQNKANKKRGPSCTGRVKRHPSQLGAGHGVLTEGIMLGQDVVPKRKRGRGEPMSGFQHAAGCKAAGESRSGCSQIWRACESHQPGSISTSKKGLHFDQHVGVPHQAILACEVIVQVQV